jgi:hypothetical protein
MIEAGKVSQIEWGEGNWSFLDIGFSGARSARGNTCGLVIGNSEPECVNFATAKERIVHWIAGAQSHINLVIEAPLSVCFSAAGLPTGRSIERKDGKSRYWYVGPGCAVMVATMYLVRAINDVPSSHSVRLFEAFISYKDRGVKSDHKHEAKMLRDLVQRPQKSPESIIPAEALKLHPDDQLSGAFRVLGLDCGVPSVIML